MDVINLDVKSREMSEKLNFLRDNRQIPAIFYGAGEKNLNLKIFEGDFVKVYREAGENTIVELNVDGKEKKKVLIHYVDRDPVTDKVIHVDFMNISMKKKITTHVPLNFIGTSLAVKDLGGILSHNKDFLTIRCLPTELIHEVDIDISGLVALHDAVRVKDVKFSENIEVLEDPEDVVATVVAPRIEVEEPVAAAVAGEAGAEEKKEGEAAVGAQKNE